MATKTTSLKKTGKAAAAVSARSAGTPLNHKHLLEQKQKLKTRMMGVQFAGRKPVLFIDFPRTLKQEELVDLLDGVEALGVATLVHGVSSKKAPKVTEHIRLVDKEKRDEACSAADFAVLFEHDQVQFARGAGCVPVAPHIDDEATPDYNPVMEKGDGFYFKNRTKWEVFAAIVRALETYRFPYDWNNVVKESVKKA